MGQSIKAEFLSGTVHRTLPGGTYLIYRFNERVNERFNKSFDESFSERFDKRFDESYKFLI